MKSFFKDGMQIIHMATSNNNNNNKPRTIHVDEQEKTVFLACEIKRRNTELQWFHNDSQIVKNPPYVLTWNKRSAFEKGSVLMIRPLKRGRASDGKYDCVANIGGGKKITASVNIIVRERKSDYIEIIFISWSVLYYLYILKLKTIMITENLKKAAYFNRFQDLSKSKLESVS